MHLIPLGFLCLQPHIPTAFIALGLVGNMLFIKHVVERESTVLKPCQSGKKRDASGQLVTTQKRSNLHLSQEILAKPYYSAAKHYLLLNVMQ